MKQLRVIWEEDLRMLIKQASDRLIDRLGEYGLRVETIVSQRDAITTKAVWTLTKKDKLVIVPEDYAVAVRMGKTDWFLVVPVRVVVHHYITKHTIGDVDREQGKIGVIRDELERLAMPDQT